VWPERPQIERIVARQHVHEHVGDGKHLLVIHFRGVAVRDLAVEDEDRAMAEARADDAIRWEVLARRLGERAVWGDERFVVYEYVDDWRDIRDTGAWHIIPYLIASGAVAVKDPVLELPDPFRDYAEESERFGKSIPSLLRR